MIILSIIIVWLVITVILDIKKGKKYSMKITPTMKFIFAVGANTNKNADCNAIDLGGNPSNNWAKRHMRKMLKSGWNVKSAEDLKETINWLFNGGHNVECMELIGRYKQDAESIKSKKFFKADKENDKKNLEKIASEYEKQGILAWDLCRVCNVAGWGFLAKYISYEEAISICVDACKMLQSNYDSWDHMMESYFLGLWYWGNGGSNNSIASRRLWYISSKNDPCGTYSIPWNTILDVNDVIPPRKK